MNSNRKFRCDAVTSTEGTQFDYRFLLNPCFMKKQGFFVALINFGKRELKLPR